MAISAEKNGDILNTDARTGSSAGGRQLPAGSSGKVAGVDPSRARIPARGAQPSEVRKIDRVTHEALEEVRVVLASQVGKPHPEQAPCDDSRSIQIELEDQSLPRSLSTTWRRSRSGS
jgi:hypothetical protein